MKSNVICWAERFAQKYAYVLIANKLAKSNIGEVTSSQNQISLTYTTEVLCQNDTTSTM